MVDNTLGTDFVDRVDSLDEIGNALSFSLHEKGYTEKDEQEFMCASPLLDQRTSAFPRVSISNEEHFVDTEAMPVCQFIREASNLRHQYQKIHNTRNTEWTLEQDDQDIDNDNDEENDQIEAEFCSKHLSTALEYAFQMRDGVCSVYALSPSQIDLSHPLFSAPELSQFIKDRSRIIRICADPKVKSFAYRRLKALELRYQFHRNLNGLLEDSRTKSGDNVDLYSVLKVDNHIHLAASMNASHLLRFIHGKIENCPDDVVLLRENASLTSSSLSKTTTPNKRTKNNTDNISLCVSAADSSIDEAIDETNGKHGPRHYGVTLRQLMGEVLPPEQKLTIDLLDVQADMDTYMRFDRFNNKYNPLGASELRTVFLKTSNFMNGRYFAELASEVLRRTESLETIALELRVSIYGNSGLKEWSQLAGWVVQHGVKSTMNRWLIQVPRIYNVHRKQNYVKNFGEMLGNIFKPLFEVTVNPSKDPELHEFLKYVVGFDSVDDESKLESPLANISPTEWNSEENPPYAYYAFFMYANICVLNKLRKARGMNTFSFRPHCGESGAIEHLADAFLLADSINHGITLRSSPSLQYLYYLEQIGLSLSPISNNKLFLEYINNPFPKFFDRGLNVTLSTDDPLQFHRTNEPLMEEYSVASQIWRLSTVDLSEIARNSVLQSGFDHKFKTKWLGANYRLPGVEGNDQNFTNIPNMRVEFRYETWQKEWALIEKILAGGNQPNCLSL